jgi:hypothetical protein
VSNAVHKKGMRRQGRRWHALSRRWHALSVVVVTGIVLSIVVWAVSALVLDRWIQRRQRRSLLERLHHCQPKSVAMRRNDGWRSNRTDPKSPETARLWPFGSEGCGDGSRVSSDRPWVALRRRSPGRPLIRMEPATARVCERSACPASIPSQACGQGTLTHQREVIPAVSATTFTFPGWFLREHHACTMAHKLTRRRSSQGSSGNSGQRPGRRRLRTPQVGSGPGTLTRKHANVADLTRACPILW